MAVTPIATYASLVIAAGSAAYGAYSTNQAQKAQRDALNGLKPPELPKQPNRTSFATDQQKAQALAMSAGGSILSDPKQNRIGSSPTEQRKSLIGS